MSAPTRKRAAPTSAHGSSLPPRRVNTFIPAKNSCATNIHPMAEFMGWKISSSCMHPDEFRSHAHQLVDWMADYMRDVGQRPVTAAVNPGDIVRRLPGSPPEAGEPFAQ